MSVRAAEQVSRDTSVMTETAERAANALLEPIGGYGIISPEPAEATANGSASGLVLDHCVHEALPRDDAVLSRFWAKVELHDDDCPCCTGCWLWQAALTTDGYGRFWFEGRVVRAHRFAYTLLVGEISDELVLDHVAARGCTNRHCVNPAHLEAVTDAENTRRGIPANSAKTKCPAGHAYDDLNTRTTPDGRRHCRRCERELRQLRHLERSDLAA